LNIAGFLPPSLLAERLEELAYLYSRADAAVAVFAEGSGISCPGGCGMCCESFVPDILPLEAAYIATFLAGIDRDLAFRIAAEGVQARVRSDGQTGCPLYRDESIYHCGIYEARPLVCRMFAFSAVRGKNGEPMFSVCRHGEYGLGARLLTGKGLVEVFGLEPPVIADMGSELVAIDPSSSGGRKALPEALAEASGLVLFLIGMNDRKDDDPDLQPPIPRAG
jgi:Fe-S-cluster containining protein